MPLPAPTTTTTCRASSFSAGMRLQLGLFEQPVLDVERFLLRQRDVLVDRLGAAHHLDGAVVELGGDARLALVLAPGDHARGRGSGSTVGFGSRIAGEFGVLAAPRSRRRSPARYCSSPSASFGLQRVDVVGLRIPVDVQRLDLGAQEVVGAATCRARPAAARRGCSRSAGCVASSCTVPMKRFCWLTCPRSHGRIGQQTVARAASVERLVLLRRRRSASPLSCASMYCGGLLDQVERQLVAGLVVVGPVDQAVLAQHDALALRDALATTSCIARPSSKPGRSQGVQTTSSP